MKLALIGTLLAAGAAIPGVAMLGDHTVGSPADLLCRPGVDAELFRRGLQVPVTASVAPGMGEVRVTRHAAAVLECSGGRMRLGLQHGIDTTHLQGPAAHH